MSRLTFGQDVPTGEPVPMAYVAWGPRCGHAVVIEADRRADSLRRFFDAGVDGYVLSREPITDALRAAMGSCSQCAKLDTSPIWGEL